MNRKRYYIIIGLLCLGWASIAVAEPSEPENILKIKYGWISQLDPYLSPLKYKGNQISIGNEWWQPFRADTAHWTHVGRIDIEGLRAYSAAGSNLIYGFGFYGGWGGYYHYGWFGNRLKVMIGPYLEGNFMVREIETNVNKPLSFDVGADIQAMAGISWSFYGTKTSYRLRYLIRTNLIGIDWLPDYWESYYEVTEGVDGKVRCSGPWNHNLVRHELTLDFQFPHSTWRLGAEHAFLNYGTKQMQYTRNQISIVIGCIWHYRIIPNKKL